MAVLTQAQNVSLCLDTASTCAENHKFAITFAGAKEKICQHFDIFGNPLNRLTPTCPRIFSWISTRRRFCCCLCLFWGSSMVRVSPCANTGAGLCALMPKNRNPSLLQDKLFHFLETTFEFITKNNGTSHFWKPVHTAYLAFYYSGRETLAKSYYTR